MKKSNFFKKITYLLAIGTMVMCIGSTDTYATDFKPSGTSDTGHFNINSSNGTNVSLLYFTEHYSKTKFKDVGGGIVKEIANTDSTKTSSENRTKFTMFTRTGNNGTAAKFKGFENINGNESTVTIDGGYNYFHECLDHSIGCGIGVGAELKLLLKDEYSHWLDPYTWGYNTGTAKDSCGSYIYNYTLENTISHAGSDNDSLKDMTSILHLEFSMKYHDALGGGHLHEDDKGNKLWIYHTNGWINDGADKFTYSTRTVPNSSYITFVEPKNFNIINGNSVAYPLDEGRFVIRRDLKGILALSNSYGEKFNTTNLDLDQHLKVCTLFTTYNSKDTSGLTNVGNIKNSGAGKDNSVGTSLAVLGYHNQSLKTPSYSYGSSNSKEFARSFIKGDFNYYEYHNNELSGTYSGHKYYSSNIIAENKTATPDFDITCKDWKYYNTTSKSLANGAKNIITVEKINGVDVSSYAENTGSINFEKKKKLILQSPKTKYVSAQTSAGKNYAFTDQGDIAYVGKDTGAFSVANEMFVDSVYGKLRASAVGFMAETDWSGAWTGKYLWKSLTQGFNSVENVGLFVAMPEIGGSITVTDNDNVHGFNSEAIDYSENPNFTVENIGDNGTTWKITPVASQYLYSINNSYINDNKTSSSGSNLYTAKTIEFSTLKRKYTPNQYRVHFITSYGALFNTHGSFNNGQAPLEQGAIGSLFDPKKAGANDIVMTNASGDTPVGIGFMNNNSVAYSNGEYVKTYTFGSMISSSNMPKAELSRNVTKSYETVRAENVNDNTGCHWYVATKNADGTYTCNNWTEENNLYSYLTGYSQKNEPYGGRQVAIDLPNGTDIYVMPCWSPTKIRFYLNSDDGVVYVADSQAYYSYRDAMNKKGDLHNDLNKDGRANELINYVDHYGMNSWKKYGQNATSYDPNKNLYFIEIYNDAWFDSNGKFTGYAENAIYRNGELVFPSMDTCYGYNFERADHKKTDSDTNTEAPWLYWCRFISNDSVANSVTNPNNFVGWNEFISSCAPVNQYDKGSVVAYNTQGYGNKAHSNIVNICDTSGSKIKPYTSITGNGTLFTFNAVNDGKDYGNANDNEIDQIYLYGAWYPQEYNIEYDGNNNWNQNYIKRQYGMTDGEKYVQQNILYNKTINLFGDFKRDVGDDNTFDIAEQALHDNSSRNSDASWVDDLDEWKLLGYYCTSHGTTESRITPGDAKSVGNFSFDISLYDNGKLNESNVTRYNFTPNNEVRGLIANGQTIKLKSIWRRAVAVEYDLNGGYAVTGKFNDSNRGLNNGNETKLYVAGYMWNDDYNLKLKVPYGTLDKATGTSDSIKRQYYRFTGWAFDEHDMTSPSRDKSGTINGGLVTVVDSRISGNDKPNVADNASTKDLNEAVNTIERFNETFKPDGMVYADAVGDGYPSFVADLQLERESGATNEETLWNKGDRKDGCRHNIIINSAVLGDEVTPNDLTVNGVGGLPSKEYDFYAEKKLNGSANNENGFSKSDEVIVINSTVAHAMWEGIFQAKVSYSVQGDERKTLQYSLMNKQNYDSEYIKREYAGAKTGIRNNLLNKDGALSSLNDMDVIDSLQGGNLFETSVTDMSAVDKFVDMIAVRQFSSKNTHFDASGNIVIDGGTLDKQFNLVNNGGNKAWNLKSNLPLVHCVVGTYTSGKNDGLNPENGLPIEGNGPDMSGIDNILENQTTLLTGLNGVDVNTVNKGYGFYRNNVFTSSNKLSVDNYNSISIRYREYIPLYLHYTTNPNASDRNFIDPCTYGEAGAYAVQTELRKVSFYYSLHTNSLNSNYNPELLRIPVQINILASEINSSGGGTDDPIPPIPDTPPTNPTGGDISQPNAEGGGVKSTLDLPEH